MSADSHPEERRDGLAFWMARVLEECDRASAGFAPDPVHDLRVALRRCRSLADGLMAMDPDPSWKQMKKAARGLFQSLGELRDVQVMDEWVHHFDSPGDPVAGKMFEFLAQREAPLKQLAEQALREFDRKQWRKWSGSLPRRARALRIGNSLFQHLALERWTQARELHRRALHHRSQVSWHSLRIGIKRFRYIVENFLPQQHAMWADDLKKLQDVLGEVHDLDLLWATIQRVNPFPEEEFRSRWHDRIAQERAQRIERYREKMTGKAALWQVWRAALPQGNAVEKAALQRLRRWASVLDPDFRHSNHVAHLALQLYDGFAAAESKTKPPQGKARQTLRLAALLHDVGRSEEGKGHHKTTARLIEGLTPPPGIAADVLRLAGIVARYHRGALPRSGQQDWRSLTLEQRAEALWLAGILRLANALDGDGKGSISRLEVHSQEGYTVVAAQGYSPRDPSAERIAAARHLLELASRRPVMIKTLRPTRPPSRSGLRA